MSIFKACPSCGGTYAGPACPECATKNAPTRISTPAPLASGQTFRGLEVIEILGRGGMGVVYKARQTSLDRIVALKTLPPERARFPEFGERFEREAKALAALAHPNIVTVHDFGREGDVYFFVMEFVEGESLREKLRGGKLPPAEALRIATQVCDALEFAHGRGIVHRDVKPENILFDGQGRVRLADFGLAKLVGPKSSDLTQTGLAVGTAAYMAPEQLENAREVDARADIYATGVVLYEMLAGQLPLGRFEPPSKVAGTDPALDGPVLQALSKDRAARPPTIAAFRDALRPAPAPAPVRRSPAWLALLALPLVAVGAWFLIRKKPDAPPQPPPEEPVEKILSSLLPDAAAVDATLWKMITDTPKFPPPPHRVADQRLTYVLIRQRPPADVTFAERRFREALGAIARPERITVLQPDFIREVRFDRAAGRGTCRFESPTYRGEVEFSAAIVGGRWEITEFRCPKGGEKTTRQADGKWLATFGERTVDPLEFEEIRALQGHTHTVFALALQPDGAILATGSADTTIKLWEMGQQRPPRTALSGMPMVLSLAFSHDGKFLAAAAAAGPVKVLDMVDRRPPRVLDSGGDSCAVAFSSDGRWFAATARDGTLRVWSAAGFDLKRTVSAHPKSSDCLAFQPGGRLLATGGDDGKIRFWDAEDGREVRSVDAHESDVRCVAWSSDGSLLASAGTDAKARIWSSEGTAIHTLTGHVGKVHSVAFHSSGKILASAGADNSVRLWDVEEGKELRKLEGHKADVFCLAWVRDGAALLSGSQDRTVRIWAVKR